MNTPTIFKKTLITGLTFAMVLGGASSAFANNKEKGEGKDSGRDHKSSHINAKGNVQFGEDKLKIILNFKDIEGNDVEWAAKNIASLASKRIFQGYDDGTFQPRRTVNHIEAIITAVRLMGLGDKAESAEEMNTKLNFKDADKLAEKYPNAVGYVAVAVENDLFLETDVAIQPEKAASRLWATTLLIKALKLDAEAKAKMNTQLTFKDADEIPAGSVGYIAVAVEKKLISGFENNTFRPNAPVTRAQLAALLDRTGDHMKGNEAVKGTVTAAVYNNTLSLVKEHEATTIVLDPNAFIYRNNVKVAASAIQVGDKVRAHLYNGVALFVEVIELAQVTPVPPVTSESFTVTGLFKGFAEAAPGQKTISVLQTVNGVTQTSIFNVAANVIYLTDINLLVDNRAVELKGINSTIISIEAK